MKRIVSLLFVFFSVLASIYAQEMPLTTSDQPSAPQEASKTKFDDNYYADPFSDLADLESQDEEETEEAIDRFYAYGRIFHLSAYADAVYMYGGMSEIYHRGWMMGAKISYFLDWDVAITFNVGIGKASMSFINPVTSDAYPEFIGSATLFNMGVGLKYYLNFHDISRIIAYLNPAFIAGAEISLINDRLDLNDIPVGIKINDPSHKVVAPGLFFGASLEFPIFRKSIYIGSQFLYHLSFFPSTNHKIPSGDPHFGALDYSGTYATFGGYVTFNL